MTTTPSTSPAPAGDPTPTSPAPTPQASPASGATSSPAAPAADREVRYCLYDNTYKRFVGPVTSERPNKAAIKRVSEQHTLGDESDLVVREV